MMAKLGCAKCAHEIHVPVHCNRPMHIEKVGPMGMLGVLHGCGPRGR